MPRQARLFFPGVAAHIVQRAANGSACFRRENDYILYLLHLRELSARHRIQVHAYCLMTNHVHLLLSPESTDGCQALMKELGQCYAQYFNRTYARTGPLWGRRYYSCIAESAQYVLACYRYIELNPVRAGMVADPSEYQWSSHRVNAGAREDSLISPHEEFLALGTEESTRRPSYKALFADALNEKLLERIRVSTVGGYPLASEAFASTLGTKLHPSRPGPRRKAGSSPRSVPGTDL